MTTWFTTEASPSGANVGAALDDQAGRSNAGLNPVFIKALAVQGSRILRKLPVGPSGTQRRSVNFESTSPVENKGDFTDMSGGSGTYRKLSRLYSEGSRFPKMEDMPHFHYDFVDLGDAVKICLYVGNGADKRYHNGNEEEGILLVNVVCRGKSWILTRTAENFRGLDRQLHRCLFDRKHSKLRSLSRMPDGEACVKNPECRQVLQDYLARLSQLADDVMNCGPVLNWLELDNHGNHMLLTDESPINVPGIAAAHVIKRYTAQAADEISLEVGEIISVIDMPPVDESVWWRGKQGFEVGFFPSQCVEVIGDKTDGSTPLPRASTSPHMKPVAKKRGKIVTFLRLFLSSRPSKARLMQSGILKERTFGCDLGEHLAKTSQDVPLVLLKCAEVIEKNGIVDGIYRLSGMSSNIQKLRLAFDGDEAPNLLRDMYIRDIHCISSLLKMYFRELPNPLLTYHLYDRFVAAIKITDESERQIAVHHVVQQLPPPHYRTLEYLLRHLSHVASYSSQTGMHAKNLAIVWSPNLLRSMSMESGGAALLQVNVQAVIIEYLIRNAHVFFDKHAAAAVIVANPRYSTGSQDRQRRVVSDYDIGNSPSLGPRMASLSISPPTKLISLEEARLRAMSTPSKPSFQSARVTSIEAPKRSVSPVYRSSVEVPARRKSTDGTGSLSGRKWKGFFNKGRSFEGAQSVAKIQETSKGTYVSVVPQRDAAENVRQTRSAESISKRATEETHRPRVDVHRNADSQPEKNDNVNELTTPVHQPVTISFIHQPVRRERTHSGEMHIRRHPVLTSFKRVSSEQTVFYTKVEYHPVRSSHRRASTGNGELESSARRRDVTTNPEHRPVSVYDNRPISVYDNEPTTFRYSSPVFSKNYHHAIPEENHRYSTPVHLTTPPMQRKSKGRLSDHKIAVTGARLAHASLVPCSDSNRPTQ